MGGALLRPSKMPGGCWRQDGEGAVNELIPIDTLPLPPIHTTKIVARLLNEGNEEGRRGWWPLSLIAIEPSAGRMLDSVAMPYLQNLNRLRKLD